MTLTKHILPAILLISTLLFSALPLSSISAKDKVEYVRTKEMKKDMALAISKARSTLDTFWRKMEKPGSNERGFSLKVGISNANITEHFWLIKIRRQGNKIYGEINNDPNDVKLVKKGQVIEIPPGDISDWMYVSNGKIVGNRTLRVLMKYNKALAQQYAPYLANE